MELDSAELQLLRDGLMIMVLRGLGDPEAAEEVVQETLARTLCALRDGRLRNRQKLGAFVRGIARHVIADSYRAGGRLTGLGALEANEPDSNTADPLLLLVREEERARVRVALGHLSDQDREILSLSFFQGLSPTQIGERLGLTSEVVRKRKSRALARLRRAYLEGSRR